MFETDQTQFFESVLFQSTGHNQEIEDVQFITGGNINNTVRLKTNESTYFLKWNEGVEPDLFEKEALGLKILRNAACITVPEVLGLGKVGGKYFLLLEYIQREAPHRHFWKLFAEGLAAQHKHLHQEYGLDHDNHIGKLPQKNEFQEDWISFFIENRLEIQLGLAIYNELIDQNFVKKFRLIYDQLPGLIPEEPPSLLHGDLWSGNFMVGPEGKACIFDPAVYYGHREMEIAFTRLFGGYDPEFYQSYHEAYPLEQGFEERMDLYNLYPLLVHVNLFGRSYLSGIERTLTRFC